FLTEDMQRRLTDENGNFELYRQIMPLDIPRLFFVGYGSSLFSPLSAEAAAMWVVSCLKGGSDLPAADARRAFTKKRLDWMIERTEGKHARGTNIIPFSLRHVDEVLDEIGVNVGPMARFRQWLLPADPSSYQTSTRKLHEKLDSIGPSSLRPTVTDAKSRD
ncbi:MAG: monooxygenase, partial [Rhodococcus sp. (in: high G+C Gram-positive bacteria)]